MRTQRIHQHVALVLINKRIAFDLHPARQSLYVHGNRRRDVLRQPLVHKIQRGADGYGRDRDANQKPHLLPEGSCSHQITSLQVLRSRAGNRRRDAHSPSNHQREDRVSRTGPSGEQENGARRHQRCDAHAADRIRRIAQQPADPPRHGYKQESKDHHEHGRKRVLVPLCLCPLDREERQHRPDHGNNDDRSADHPPHGNLVVNAARGAGRVGFPVPFGANIFQAGAKSRDDRRHRPQQGNQPRSGNRACAHRPYVAAPYLVRRHQRNRNRRRVDRRVAGQLAIKLDGRHHHQPRHDSSREQNSRYPRPDDVADAEIFRRDRGAERCTGKPTGACLRLPRPGLHRIHQEGVNPAQSQSPEHAPGKRSASLSGH